MTGPWSYAETAGDWLDQKYSSLSYPKHWALEVCSAGLLLLVAALLIAAVRSRHG